MYLRKKNFLRGLSGRIIIVLGITMVFLGVTFVHAFAAEKVTITWWKAPNIDNAKERWQPILAKFEEENPNIKVEHVITTYEGWLEKHMPAYAAGTPPDVCLIPQDFFPAFAHAGYLQSLDEIDPEYLNQMKEYTYSRSVSANIYKGQLLGVPMTIISFYLIYNKDLFKESGLDPNKPPNTWDELVEYGQRIVQTETAKYGIIWTTTPSRLLSLWWAGFLYSAGGKKLSEDLLHCKVNEPAGVKALEFMRDLYTKYRICPQPGMYSESEVPNFFFQQESGMLFFEESTATLARKYLPEGALGISFWPVATQEQFDQGKIYNRGWASGNCVARLSKHKEEAFKLAKFLGSPFALKFWCEATSCPSPRKDVVVGQDDPLMQAINSMVPYFKSDPNSIYIPRMDFMQGDAVMAALVGKKSPKEALDDLAREIESFLSGD